MVRLKNVTQIGNVILTVIAILLVAHLAIRTGEPAFAHEVGLNVNGPLEVRLVNGEDPVKVMLWVFLSGMGYK